MREEWARVEYACSVEMSDGRDAERVKDETAPCVTLRERAAPFEHEQLFRLGLSRVNHQRQSLFNREAREHLQKLRRDGIGRVWREPERDEICLSAAQLFNLRARLVELFARKT